jgi:hypothetical protein
VEGSEASGEGFSPDVALTDEHASMMVGLGQSELEDLRLETTFQEILHLETENVIELHARFVQDSNADETTEQGITWGIVEDK